MFRKLAFSAIAAAAVLAAAGEPQPFHRPLVFEPNLGQAPEQVKWIARTSSYTLFITGDGVAMVVPEGTKGGRSGVSTVRMKLPGSRPWKTGTGLEPTGGTSNYFVGSDRKSWVTGIPHYARVSVPSVYDGIDLVFYSKGEQLEYDFVVAPGADPEQIRLTFQGAKAVRVDSAGDLVVKAGGSEIRHVRPHVYQDQGGRRVEIAGGYRLLDRTEAAFTLASYDRSRTLVIDPTVSFTVFLSGNNTDIANAIATDAAGNSYVAGFTLSSNFPLVAPLQPRQPQNGDAFVTKLSPSGAILFSTYWGGFGSDNAAGIAVDSTGVYITGDTLSSDFPGSRNLPVNGQSDMFVTKFSPAGNSVIYSFALGGTSYDAGKSIAVDASHNAYVTGYTYSPDFPSIGPWRPIFGGSVDAFVMKVSPTGTVTNSIFLGGNSTELGYGIAVDGLNYPWITGMTCSANFPRTGPLPQAPGCNTFVTRINSAFNGFAFSNVFGGGNNFGAAIAVSGGFFGFVTGTTYSSFPTTPGAFQTAKPSSASSAFVMKLDSLGNIWYSTYLGATDGGYTNGLSIAPGLNDEVYISGLTSSSAFPGAPILKPNPTAGWVTRMMPQLNGINFTTLLGAAVNRIALYYPSQSPLVQPQIYTAGQRYTGGLNYQNLDAFVVKLVQ